jgi:oxygen-independent coproporphyrinogen III oxidase
MTLFHPELIRKYDRPGPRYTSYPTAPHLDEAFDESAFRAALDRSNASGRPLSLYVHLPFCPSLCLYCACNVVITRRRDRVEAYLDVLEREIDQVARLVRSDRPVEQLHWGGGTPSYLDPHEIRRLGHFLAERFRYADDIEASVEIDPRGVTREHLEAFREVGFNRVSLGVQDVDPHVQEVIHRVQPVEVTQQVVDWSRELGFESVNIDLVYGLPFQTVEGVRQTLKTVLALAPDRFAVFNYAHVPFIKQHQNAIPVEALPGPNEKLAILELVIDELTAGGYQFIGMDHFARPDDELAEAQRNGTLWRNFQGYTTRAGVDLLGFGVTSLGLFDDAYYQNEKELKPYEEAVEAGRLPVVRGLGLTPEDQLRRHVIMTLMCQFGLDVPALEARFGLDFWEHFAEARERLRAMEGDGLLTVTAEGLEVHEKGRLLIRNVAMLFDEYLDPSGSRFSRTV